MKTFREIREKQSDFYRNLWDEVTHLKIIDTHEHLWDMADLSQLNRQGHRHEPFYPEDKQGNWLYPPALFYQGYVYIQDRGSYKNWVEELKKYNSSGYLRLWKIACEDLYGLEGPISAKFLQSLEEKVNQAYENDFQHNTYHHFSNILQNEMHVETVINDTFLGAHLKFPQPSMKAAANLSSILDGIQVPSHPVELRHEKMTSNQLLVYWFVENKLGHNLADIATLEDYLIATNKLLNYVKSTNSYCAVKIDVAYERTLQFNLPENKQLITDIFNKKNPNQRDIISFGNFMMHFILKWMSENWRIPIQIHTGLARMYNRDSDALNLSNLFEMYPDLTFDIFHGNYPYGNLTGMMHQIPNITADFTWYPLISPTAATRDLTEMLELGDMLRLNPIHTPKQRLSLFGGDTAIIEAAYGALQMSKDVLVRSLEDLYNRGHIFLTDAIDIAEEVLYRNPKRIFKL
jgi:hypothetical protein